MFNTHEQALIQRSKDLEADAKTLRKDAERLRRERLVREAKEKDNLRVKNFLLDVTAAARKHGFRFEGKANQWAADEPRFNFNLIDTDNWNRITVTPVAQYGFKWTDGRPGSFNNGSL